LSDRELAMELKQLIVDALMLEDIAPEDIEDEAPLFGEGLGLDSIDALELGMAISKKYDIKMSKDQDENRSHFASVQSLADYVAGQRDAAGSRHES